VEGSCEQDNEPSGSVKLAFRRHALLTASQVLEHLELVFSYDINICTVS
jgi:hypothetical protein